MVIDGDRHALKYFSSRSFRMRLFLGKKPSREGQGSSLPEGKGSKKKDRILFSILALAAMVSLFLWYWFAVMGRASTRPIGTTFPGPSTRKTGRDPGRTGLPFQAEPREKKVPSRIRLSKAAKVFVPMRPKDLVPPTSMKIITQDWDAKKILEHPYFSWMRKKPPLCDDLDLCRKVDGLLIQYKYHYKKYWKEIVRISHKTAIEIVKNGFPVRKPHWYKGRVQPVSLLYKGFSGEVELTQENAPDVFIGYAMMEMWTKWLIWSVENAILDHLSRSRKGARK